jgi:hypothetical protein
MPARDPAPDHERSGRDVEGSVARAERGSPVAGGGAQRIAGARVPDRKAGGEPVPDGPPFDEQE